MSETNTDFHIGDGSYINVQTSSIVKLNEQFIVHTEEGPITLTVDIIADFAKIDKKYHEIFFNILSSKYLNRASFGDNPFSECRPIIKRKWWQFWKSKYVEQIKN
jgi:hypothetical protein